jgi:hypothetical protein
VRVLQDGKPQTEVVSGKPIHVEAEFDVLQESIGLHLTLQLLDAEGMLLFESIDNGMRRRSPASSRTLQRPPPCSRGPSRADELRAAAARGIHGVRSLLPKPIRLRLNVTGLGRVNRAYPGYRTTGRLAPLLEWNTERRDP